MQRSKTGRLYSQICVKAPWKLATVSVRHMWHIRAGSGPISAHVRDWRCGRSFPRYPHWDGRCAGAFWGAPRSDYSGKSLAPWSASPTLRADTARENFDAYSVRCVRCSGVGRGRNPRAIPPVPAVPGALMSAGPPRVASMIARGCLVAITFLACGTRTAVMFAAIPIASSLRSRAGAFGTCGPGRADRHHGAGRLGAAAGGLPQAPPLIFGSARDGRPARPRSQRQPTMPTPVKKKRPRPTVNTSEPHSACSRYTAQNERVAA